MNSIETRRAQVALLAASGNEAPVIAELLATSGIVNPRTHKPYTVRTIQADVTAVKTNGVSTAAVSEMIGRFEFGRTFWQPRTFQTVDQFRTDYQFWDRLRRCKAEGFELGGLFAQPINQILASYTLGMLPTVTLEADDAETTLDDDAVAGDEDSRKYTDGLIGRFLRNNHADLLRMTEDKYALGDQFVIVNPDGSLSIPSPDTVKVEWSKTDYRMPVKYTVYSQVDGVQITDEYRLDGRTLTIREGSETRRATFDNLIGRLPVVHFANNRSANELYGRPSYEGAFRAFSRYDDLIEKALNGTEIVSNPIPVFEGMEDVQATIDANGSPSGESYIDPNGNERPRSVIEFDTLAAIIVGKGGAFNFKSPTPGFTDDVVGMLKMLFSLILQHVRVPEFAWGSAIASSKASAETQMPPFIQYISMLQIELLGRGADEVLDVEAMGGLLELVDIWLRMRHLTDRKVVVGATVAQFPDLTQKDAAATLQGVIYARSQAALTKATMLEKLRLVPNPQKEIEKAEAEMPDMPTDDFMTQLSGAARRNMNPTTAENPAGGDPGYNQLNGPRRSRNGRRREAAA